MSILKQLRRRMMLTCEDVNDFLAAYLDDDIPDNLRRRYEAHIACCEVCSAYLEQYRTTISLARSHGAADGDAPDALVEMTLAFLNQQLDNGHEDPDT